MPFVMRPATVVLLLAALAPATASAVSFQLGHRPEIGSIRAPETATAGRPIPITVNAKQDGNSDCGMLVTFGDGTDRQFKMNGSDGKFPITMEHTYAKDGRYTVRATGRVITTNKECKGSASTVIQVGAPKKAAKPK